MFYTKYRTLSNDELLCMVGDRIAYSPIITELCSRIEQLPEDDKDDGSGSEAVTMCPVCDASLMMEIFDDELVGLVVAS